MKTQEMRDKSVKELAQMLTEALQEQFNLRMQKVPGQVVKSHLIKGVKRRVAQIKTIMTEKSR